MADEQELLVEIEGEGQVEDAEVSNESDPVDQLTRQLEALKEDNKKRAEAEAAANRRASEERAAAEVARQEAQAARTSLADREVDAVAASISAAQAEADSATQEFAAAAEAGDFKKQAEAQRKIARAEARVAALEGTKAELEVRKTAPRVEEPPQQRSADSFEDHLRNFTARTAGWMREHRDWVTDPRKNAKLVGAHHLAVGDGLMADTDEYFAHVEKTLGIGQQETAPARSNGAGNGSQQRSPARRTTPAVAPVNGGAGAHSSGAGEGRGANTVVLTKGERDMATDGTIVWNRGNIDPKTGEPIKADDPRVGKPIGVHEYARRKLALDKGGFYDKSYSHG